MAQLSNKSAPGNWDYHGDKAYERMDKQFNELLDKAKLVDPDVSLVGAVVSFPWADSAAYYVVSKDKPLTLQHIPFCDAWHVPDAYIRGMRKSDIIDIVMRERKTQELFGQKK